MTCLCDGNRMCMRHERELIERRIAAGTPRPNDQRDLQLLDYYEADMRRVCAQIDQNMRDARDAFELSRADKTTKSEA